MFDVYVVLVTQAHSPGDYNYMAILSSTKTHLKADMVAHASHLHWEQKQDKLKASLSYTKLCLKTTTNHLA